MSTVEEKLAKSLTAESVELIPYLPYLLQDLWELGSSPNDMVHLVSENIDMTEDMKILDLACGKGAVSIHMAKRFGCRVKGIDLMPDFIEDAVRRAQEHGVGDLCEFAVGDITQAVRTERDYDIVILGAVGNVLGNPQETLSLLKNTVKKGGYILLDDAYGDDETGAKYPTRDQWLTIFGHTGVRLVGEKLVDNGELASLNREQQELIAKRADELKEKLPEKAHLFDDYIRSQQAECDELENEISGVTMLLQSIEL